MSLHFIFGRSGTGKTTRCCEEIARYVETPGRSALFLVPDQATYRAESMLAAAFPGGGFMNTDVYGFSRLSYRVFQEISEDTNEALSPLVQQLILRRLLTAHRGEFRMLGPAARQPHFAQNLTAFFHQLDSFCCTEDDIERLAQSEGDTPLGRKMADLSLLYRSYHAYLTAHFQYRGNMYDKLAEDIPKSKKLQNSRVWIDGFNGMIPQELAIVAALARTAIDVTVTLPMDPPEEAAGMPLFDRPYRMWEALQKDIGRSDAVVLRDSHRFTCPRIRELADHFFVSHPRPCRYPPATRTLPEQGLYITEAPSRAAESAAAARRIALLVRDKGFRYRDILVLLRKSDAYMDQLRRDFEACRIPAFFDERLPMKNHPLVILIDSLLRFLAAGEKGPWKGWTRDNLFQLLKTDLLHALPAESVDRLENYVLRVGVRPYAWQKPWKYHNPFHLESDSDMPDPKELDELNWMNACRAQILDFLVPLEDQWKAAQTVKDKCALLYRWLMEQKVPDTLALWDEKAFEERRERPHIQVWKKILLLLSDMVKAAGSDILTGDEFMTTMEDGMAGLTFSMIPPTLDHVTVTTIDRGYAMEGKAVFLLGAGEGDFPSRIEESGFLSETEKEAIRKRDSLIMGPSLQSLIYQEQFYVYLSLTRSRDALYISYPAADTDGSALAPSALLIRMKELGYCTAFGKAEDPSPAAQDTSLFVTPDQSLSLLPHILREGTPAENSVWQPLRDWAMEQDSTRRLLSQKLKGFAYTNAAQPLSPAVVQKLLMPRKPYITSVTKLETYRKCPYQYFLRYGLRLAVRDQGEVDNRDFGNYLHAGLHTFGSLMKSQRKSWRNATDEDIDTLSTQIADRVAPRVKSGALLTDGAARYTKDALNRTFRAALRRFRAWSASSEADTIAMESNFRLKVAADADAFFIDCHVDRVDQAKGAAVVCDYKTGSPNLTLSEIVTGYRLQLITYLMAVLEDRRKSLLPGALLYIYLKGDTRPIPVPDGAIPAEPPKDLKGYFIDDRDFLTSLDKNLCTDDSYLPISQTKKGTWTARSPVLTTEEMGALFAVAKERLASIYLSLKSGRIPIRPVRCQAQTPCAYCDFRSICRFDPKLPGNRYEDIETATDSEVKEQLRKDEGSEE